MLGSIFALLISLALFEARKEIQCKSACYDTIESVILEDGTYLTCEITESDGIPHVKNNRTAPSPQDATAIFFPYERGYALNITWTYQERYFGSYSEENFGIIVTRELEMSFYSVQLQNHARVGRTIVRSSENDTSKSIAFNFQCFGQNDKSVIGGNETWTIYILPLPLRWHENNYNHIRINLTSPGPTTEPVTDPSPGITPSIVILACIVTSFILMVLLLALCIKKNSFKNSRHFPNVTNKVKNPRLLMILDTLEKGETKKAMQLASYLRTKTPFTVVTNWESRAPIGKGARTWYSNEIQAARIIVIVSLSQNPPDSGYLEQSNDSSRQEVQLVLEYIRKEWQSNDKDIVLLRRHSNQNDSLTKSAKLKKTFNFPVEYKTEDPFWKYITNYIKQNLNNNEVRSMVESKNEPLLEQEV